jgi:hypothetical protein
MHWLGDKVCPWCNDRGDIFLAIPGARRLQSRPCPACAKYLNPVRWPDWISPRPLTVLVRSEQ